MVANYQYIFVKAAEKPKEGEDPRSKKKTKLIDSYVFQDEKDTINQAEPFF
jgi:hypothetical protein